MRPTTITITIPVEQARALLQAASRGLDDWDMDPDDDTTPDIVVQALAFRGYRRLWNATPKANTEGKW